jgi:four helix bundle protein
VLARAWFTSGRAGTVGACGSAMGVRDFRDLIAWQLSYELKCEVFAFTAAGPASKDFKYRDQIRDSSSSAPSNIAEGFGRFRPGDFARFLEIARASLIETKNHLIDGRDRGYLANPLYSRLQNLTRAAMKATTSLLLSKKRDAEQLKRSRRRR